MPLHPAAPEDLAGLLAAYQQTVQAVVDLGRTCSDADFQRETACPGWTVKDQISHIVGLESWLNTGEVSPAHVPDHEHGRHEAGRFIEKAVEQRRHMVGSKVVNELETIATRRIQQLSAPDLSPETVIRGVWGPAPARESLRLRILDIWTHEQDIRQALGRPGDLDSGAAAVFCDVLFEALPRLVAREAAVSPGNVVIIDMTGPVVGRAGVRVETGEDGRPHGIPLFTGVAHEASGAGEESTTSITLSTQALTRRAAGRGSLEDIHYTVHGDEQVARQVLEHVVFVP
jgi:uncharacterized protein (TIGR03083 family)